jgi:hypothetical protein
VIRTLFHLPRDGISLVLRNIAGVCRRASIEGNDRSRSAWAESLTAGASSFRRSIRPIEWRPESLVGFACVCPSLPLLHRRRWALRAPILHLSAVLPRTFAFLSLSPRFNPHWPSSLLTTSAFHFPRFSFSNDARPSQNACKRYCKVSAQVS